MTGFLLYMYKTLLYELTDLQGQFSYACVEIQPLDHGSNQVTLRTRDELAELGLTGEPRVVSDLNLGILARQLALHANVSFYFSLKFYLSFSSSLEIFLIIFFLYTAGIQKS